MNKLTGLLILILAILLITGCGVSLPKGPQPGDPAYAPVSSLYSQPQVQANGSIYQSFHSPFLFEDRRARRLGDILTINLVESTSATKQADTEITKESTVDIAEPTILKSISYFGFETDITADTEFRGEADSDQRNSLQGSISVTVTEVLANGVLRVGGEKWITLNQGDEYIRITGLVRPEDIQSDNSINSTQVADARIAYSQTGALADANRSGWLTRFFNSPYWPL
jgi:flagellar L-ring protein precursor FlgH